MPRSFWRLAVQSEFSASHALRHYQGKCENIHGHNFTVEVIVQGEKLTDKTEFVVDFSTIKQILKKILNQLDHKDLNMTPPFDLINPTSENLARFIYQNIQEAVAEYQIELYCVTVGEKPGQSASYYERERREECAENPNHHTTASVR